MQRLDYQKTVIDVVCSLSLASALPILSAKKEDWDLLWRVSPWGCCTKTWAELDERIQASSNRNTTVSTNWLSDFYSHLFSLVYRKGCTHRDKMRTWMHWISSWRSLRILLHMLRAELIELVLCRCNNCFGQLSQPSTPNTLSLESKIALFLFLISCKQIFMFVFSFGLNPWSYVLFSLIQIEPCWDVLGPTTQLNPQYPTHCREIIQIQHLGRVS